MNSTGASSSSVAIDGVGNTISRCSLEQCTTSNSNLRRCRLTNCVVLNVGNASRTRAKNSQLHNVILAERSDIKESTIQSASSVHRSDLKQSVLQEKSSLERSAITKTVVSQSQIQRSCLVDCDVAECVISRCSFTGMVLKYGIWKKGVLVGKTGDMEPIQIKQNTCSKEISKKDVSYTQDTSTPAAVPELDSVPVVPFQNAVELDSKARPRALDDDSDITVDSEDSGDDLPPPYEIAIKDEPRGTDIKLPQL